MVEIVVGRDDSDLRKYGTKGTVALGKHIVGTGEETHLTTPLLLDVVRPHLILVTGKRGYGKSYTMGVIAEEMASIHEGIRENLCSVMIDTQGIFWTMKMPNEKETSVLREWGLGAKGFNAYVYVPEGQADIFSRADVNFDGVFSIQPSQLTAEDWLNVFNLEPSEMQGILLQKVIKQFSRNFTIDHIIAALMDEKDFGNERLALRNMFDVAKTWGIFGSSKMPVLLEGGKITIIDVSLTPQNVRALLVSLVCRKVLDDRIKARRREEMAAAGYEAVKKTPMPWIFIDEAHNFIPESSKTAATDVLMKIVREGRQPGITLVLATQQPGKLHPDALAQSDMIISHSVTAKADIDALKAIMQTYLLYDIGKYISELPKLKGVGIILDDNSERIYKVRIRPRQSWHAGSSPTAI